MDSRVLGLFLARLDVAAITNARLRGAFVDTVYKHHKKSVLWCARANNTHAGRG